jgi:hypothetical protein
MNKTILWRRLDLPGHEIGRLRPRGKGWELSGTALFRYEGSPCKLDYLVICDAKWWTHSASVAGFVGDREVDLSVEVDQRRNWRLNGEDAPSVAGCVDIDLGFSPSTNLLPIRRLSLAVEDEAEVRAAWLPFPGLALEPLQQSYLREKERTYRYASAGARFVRSLEVNSAGLVTSYPDFWKEEREK